MASKVRRIGGSFAPPLSPEKLEEYKALAATVTSTVVRTQMEQLIEMMEVFYQTPSSTKQGTPHPATAGKWAGKGKPPRQAMIVPLEEEEIKRIWDYVPWGEEVAGEHLNECETIAKLFEGVQADVVQRNEVRANVWRAATISHIYQERFGASRETVHQRWKSIQAFLRGFETCTLNGQDVPIEKQDQVLQLLFDTDSEAIMTEAAEITSVEEELHPILYGQEDGPIPPPAYESEALRNACFHLLWFAKELALDREPITSDQL